MRLAAVSFYLLSLLAMFYVCLEIASRINTGVKRVECQLGYTEDEIRQAWDYHFRECMKAQGSASSCGNAADSAVSVLRERNRESEKCMTK